MDSDKRNNRMGKVIGVTLAALTGGLGLLLWSKRTKPSAPSAPPLEPSEGGASITLGPLINVKTGEPVEINSPALVLPGETYAQRFTVTNKSTQSGAPVAVQLYVQMKVSTGAIIAGLQKYIEPVITGQPGLKSFGASAAGSFTASFTVPLESAGQSGTLEVDVYTPDFPASTTHELASASFPLSVATAVISYAAGVTLTEPTSTAPTVAPTDLVTTYLNQIAAATTHAQLDSIRTSFEGAYSAGQMTYEQYMTCYNAYATRWGQTS